MEKQTNYFKTCFMRHISEDNSAGAGGVFGDAGSMGHGGAVTPATDFYAPGDMRTPTGSKKDKRKSKKTKKKDGSLDVLIPTQRRPLDTSM
jgi:hypothetical protein